MWFGRFKKTEEHKGSDVPSSRTPSSSIPPWLEKANELYLKLTIAEYTLKKAREFKEKDAGVLDIEAKFYSVALAKHGCHVPYLLPLPKHLNEQILDLVIKDAQEQIERLKND